MECELKPIQGERFQPTGFPSLGAAEFNIPPGNVKALLVESAQSMANRLETVCVKADSNLAEPLDGLPLITVKRKDGSFYTNSIVEAHRMNSPYMLEGKDKTLIDKIKAELNINDKGEPRPIDIPRFAQFVLKYDTNSVLHGLFLSKSELAGGRYKLARALSSFIEATGVESVASGGVKLDHIAPSSGSDGAKSGFGHIPYSRIEYAAESITVYFNIDLSLLRSYRLDDAANDLLFTLAMWKIQSFLNSGLRLRTACDLKIHGSLIVTEPKGFSVPDLASLNEQMKSCIRICKDKGLLTKEPIEVTYTKR